MGNLHNEEADVKYRQPKLFHSRKIGKMRQWPVNNSYINKLMTLNPGSKW